MISRQTSLAACALALSLCLAGPAAPEPAALEAYERSAASFADGLALAGRGLDEDAASSYEEAIRLDAGFVEAMVNLARIRLRQGQTAQARELLDRAFRLAPEYPPIFSVRGLEARERGARDEALRDLSRARALDPTSSEVLANLGAVLVELGFDRDASQVLEDARRLAPERPEPLLSLALLFDRKGERVRAAFFYEQFLRLAGANDPDRACVEARLGRLDPRAVKAASQVSETSEKSH